MAENIFLSISTLNWPRSTVKIFLVSFSHNTYVTNLAEHLFLNVEGYSGKNSIFVDAERKYHTKIYNIILIFLVWAASKLLPTNIVNVLVFWSALTSWNIHSRLVSFRITCFTLNRSRSENVLQHKDHKNVFCRTKTTD